MNADGLAGMTNPTACLPRIKAQPGAVDLFLALCHLADLYSPQSLTQKHRTFRAGLSAQDVDMDKEVLQDALDATRADENEKRFAVSWLTRIIGSGLDWVQESESAPFELSIDGLLDLAGRVLGGHAALEESGAISRDFTFPLSEPIQIPGVSTTATQGVEPGSLKITLRDDALPPSTSYGEDGSDKSQNAAAAVGVQTWGAAVLFSDIFTRHPGLFHADLESVGEKMLKVHELGAGTGLVGMIAARYLERSGVSAEVVLSDFHEQVLDNLQYNIEHNFSESASIIPRAEKLDWFEIHQDRLQGEQVERKRYDLLLLADVVYAPNHAVWLHSSILALLEKPSSEDDRNDARAHIIMAVRPSGKHEGLYHTVEAVFGAPKSSLPSLLSSHSATPHDTMPGTPSMVPVSLGSKDREDQHSSLLHSRITALDLQPTCSHPQLYILNKRWLEKRPGVGRQDEQGYLWFEIGWTF